MELREVCAGRHLCVSKTDSAPRPRCPDIGPQGRCANLASACHLFDKRPLYEQPLRLRAC